MSRNFVGNNKRFCCINDERQPLFRSLSVVDSKDGAVSQGEQARDKTLGKYQSKQANCKFVTPPTCKASAWEIDPKGRLTSSNFGFSDMVIVCFLRLVDSASCVQQSLHFCVRNCDLLIAWKSVFTTPGKILVRSRRKQTQRVVSTKVNTAGPIGPTLPQERTRWLHSCRIWLCGCP